MKGRAITYSAAELAWLEANRTLPIGDYHAGFRRKFARDDVTAGNLHALRKRKGWKTGRTGCFEKGITPFNKGKKCPPGRGGNHPNARKTQFHKGHRAGRAGELYKPIGTERLSKNGYLERKIHDGMPLQSRWQSVQHINWEAVNGPVPEGMVLKCLDSNKLNTDPSNWALVPRAILPRLNGGRYKKRVAYDAASEDLRPAIMSLSKLEHQIHETEKQWSSGGRHD